MIRIRLPSIHQKRIQAASVLRHDFLIEELPSPRGWFKPARHRYFCLRCRWTFLVIDRAGTPIAVDDRDRSLPGLKGARRNATFADGPCPGAAATTETGAPGLLARICPPPAGARRAKVVPIGTHPDRTYRLGEVAERKPASGE